MVVASLDQPQPHPIRALPDGLDSHLTRPGRVPPHVTLLVDPETPMPVATAFLTSNEAVKYTF